MRPLQKDPRPFVSVVTPYYNGQPYLGSCIESVLEQSYGNFEYILVNNCSKDGSPDTARSYAKRDCRIRLVDNSNFLSQVQNYNTALRQISPTSTYCKIVAADDRLYPTCLEDMVRVAESSPDVAMVGAYTFLDWGATSRVYLDGLPIRTSVFDGREICRLFLLEGTYVWGSPTATLLRSEIVRDRNPFYPEDSVTEDVDICLEILRNHQFGFVHKILTYTRRDNESTISAHKQFHQPLMAEVVAVKRYGRDFLKPEELKRREKHLLKEYAHVLGRRLLLGAPADFWDFHRRGFRFAGGRLGNVRILWYGALAALDLLLNPKNTFETAISRLRSTRQN